MKKISILAVLLLIIFLFFMLLPKRNTQKAISLWDFQSIDTMKYSRDLSREKLQDNSFNFVINKQVADIAKTGATHVAIATPYDEEFYPILLRWVQAARRNNIKVLFRGNWSGWEEWFGYPKITREQHVEKTKAFIIKHPDLFQDGDIFMGCPECENGGPGDPRRSPNDLRAYRQFLIDEHKAMSDVFSQIKKNVNVDYNSMNGDVARLVMDKQTTKALGGVVVIDHYVATPAQLVSDVKAIAEMSGGKIVLGEFGAPIPNITGDMTEDEQNAWVESALEQLVGVKELDGMNYWVNVGGSTALYNDNGTPRKAASSVTSFYSPRLVSLRITDTLGSTVQNVTAQTLGRAFVLSNEPDFIPVVQENQHVLLSAKGYKSSAISIARNSKEIKIIMTPVSEGLWYKVKRIMKIFLSL